MDTLHCRANDLQGHVPSVLPIQPASPGTGQHGLGPFHIDGPRVSWTPHVPAIVPSQEYDVNGCWSGSATILPGYKPAILYTGRNSQLQQVQNLAVPKNLSDPYLIEWVKSPRNPLMAPTARNMISPGSIQRPHHCMDGR
ncbi:hypothetical protein NL676_026977 [Syzygium grande]|nr:hypothetical protein NL676_026977 [Syzygium grande]